MVHPPEPLVLSEESLARYRACGDRELFYCCLRGEDYFDLAAACRERIEGVRASLAISSPEESPLEASAREAFRRQFPLPPLPSAGENVGEILRQYAPAALLEGCWLPSCTNAATAHSPVAAELLNLRRRLRGAQSPAHHYHQLLRQAGVVLPGPDAAAFAQSPDLLDQAFRLPLLSLCLARLPRDCFPELLGWTLAHAEGWCGLGARLEAGQAAALGWPTDDRERRETVLAVHRQALCRGVAQWLAEVPVPQRSELQQRIWQGAALALAAAGVLARALESRLSARQTPRQAVVALIRNKAPVALGHHGRIRIGGKILDQWLDGGVPEAEALLDALEGAGVFDPETPDGGRFFSEFTAFGGPMFGVFSESELKQLRTWLRSRRAGSAPADRLEPAARPRFAPPPPPPIVSKFRLSQRSFYYRLVNADRYPAVLPLARQRVETVLRQAGRGWLGSPDRGYFSYTPTAFRARIESQYRQAMAAYRPRRGTARLERAVYIWGIEQFAPTVLVDGCWLQNIDETAPDEGVSSRLFRIYADEIGNGDPRRNHPNVYRELLASVGMELPDISSLAFAEHPGFLDAAFDLPVYLLAIGYWPRHFLPELIGLNLAIELSGLGAGYLQLVDDFCACGLDPAIIRLHLSIDNLSSGHAASACETVEIHLDRIGRQHGTAALQRHWQRVWTGYRSLDSAVGRFRLALVWGYWRRFVWPRWRRHCFR